MLGPLLLLLGTAAFYLAWLGAAGLYDPNGGRYADTPREMVLLRDWLTPPFNFIRYFEKPPLLQWATLILREFHPGDQIIIEGPYENFASANFYTGERARVLHGLFGDLELGSGYPEAKRAFLEEAEFAELWRGAGRVYLLTDSPSRIAKLQALGRLPVVLGRSGKNWLSSKRARPAG
jgi:hypothetical protein